MHNAHSQQARPAANASVPRCTCKCTLQQTRPTANTTPCSKRAPQLQAHHPPTHGWHSLTYALPTACAHPPPTLHARLHIMHLLILSKFIYNRLVKSNRHADGHYQTAQWYLTKYSLMNEVARKKIKVHLEEVLNINPSLLIARFQLCELYYHIILRGFVIISANMIRLHLLFFN